MSAGSNTFGKLFQFTSFGESHGTAMGVVIDGCPAGILFDDELLLKNLQRRRPGQSEQVTARDEKDQPEILSGVFEGKTLGTPIAITVRNTNTKSSDYDKVKDAPRFGHADDVWQAKFGHRDHRGGGRASARETLNWVIAGSVAQMIFRNQNLATQVSAKLTQVGDLKVSGSDDPQLVDLLNQAKEAGESYGGIVELLVENPPQNLGEPIFNKLKANLTHAMMTINAVTGVELGDGFAMATQKGSEVHKAAESQVYGGIRGGISTGENICLKLAFKPTASILDVAKQGRHDPCVVLRALPVVEAMAWNVLADHLLMSRLNKVPGT